LKTKLKGCHFDIIDVIETESQAVLNTLTEHDLQDAFKNYRMTGIGAYSRKGWWSIGSNLVFDQMAAPVPEIMMALCIIGNTVIINVTEKCGHYISRNSS
jgi:hypothetical protein